MLALIFKREHKGFNRNGDADMKTNPNMIREIYTRATGLSPFIAELDFKLWCEKNVSEWKQRADTLGYAWPCWIIGNVATGTETYHEWLNRKYN